MVDNLFVLYPEKVLLDTSIYISNLKSGLYIDSLSKLFSFSIVHLHSTVFEELLAGSRSDEERGELYLLKESFLEFERILTPTDQDWEETGLLVNRLIHKNILSPKNAVSFTHDVLLAVSVQRIGARLITENRKDFERIQRLKDFKLTVWSGDFS